MGTHSLYEGVSAFMRFEPEQNKLLDGRDKNSKANSDVELRIDSLRDLFSQTKIGHALVVNSFIMLMLGEIAIRNPALSIAFHI